MTTQSAWRLLPYPTLHDDGQEVDGSLVRVPQTCKSCRERPCQVAQVRRHKIEMCKFGMNFVRLDTGLLIFGLVVSDLPFSTKQSRKRRGRERDAVVRQRDLERVVESVSDINAQVLVDFEGHREELVQKYLASDEPLEVIVTQLRKDITSSLNQSP